MHQVFCCAGPYFALERCQVGSTAPLRRTFRTAQVLSNVGGPVEVRTSAGVEALGRAETLLLPAALGEVEITGPADVLFGYLPDLERDVVGPLLGAGYPRSLVATLGEGI